MTVYYYQGLPIIAPFTIESNEPMYSAETLSLRQSRSKQGTQRWELSFNIKFTGSAGAWFARQLAASDKVSVMTMPQTTDVTARHTLAAGVKPYVNGNTVAGQAVIQIHSAQTGRIPAGSFVTFTNHSKVYMVTEDVTTAGAGNFRTVKLYPNLQHPLTGGTQMNLLDDVGFRYRPSIENNLSLTFADGIMHEVGPIVLIEAI